jgi:O-succinylbenzoate synthase
LRIERITLREVSLVLKEPFRISSGVESHRRILLVELAGEGIEGWGECVAGQRPNYSAETVDTAWWAIREWLAERLIGQPWNSPDEVHAVLECNVRGHNMAKAALEMACWEMAARGAGVSLSSLLGGSAHLGGVRERVAVGISLGIEESPAALVAKAGAALERGYRKVKIKIQPGADIEYLAAVRRALGPEAPLMADANSAYLPADRDHLRRLDELGLMMIEQPLGGDDLLRHAELQRHLRTPICLDESITSAERAADMITLRSGRIVNIKPGRVGGFRQAIEIHDLCAASGIPVWCGGMLESGVGRAHNVALASLANFTLPGDLSPSERYWQRDIVQPEWTMDRQGWVTVPRDRPGMGVEVDREFLAKVTVRTEAIPL